MSSFIYCKTTEKGKQTFYLSFNGKDYFLFTQKYRVSNKDYFSKRVFLDNALNHSMTKSRSVRKTMTKLIPYIRYIEQEYGIVVLRKTIKNNDKKSNRRISNEDIFFWRDYIYETA